MQVKEKRILTCNSSRLTRWRKRRSGLLSWKTANRRSVWLLGLVGWLSRLAATSWEFSQLMVDRRTYCRRELLLYRWAGMKTYWLLFATEDRLFTAVKRTNSRWSTWKTMPSWLRLIVPCHGIRLSTGLVSLRKDNSWPMILKESFGLSTSITNNGFRALTLSRRRTICMREFGLLESQTTKFSPSRWQPPSKVSLSWPKNHKSSASNSKCLSSIWEKLLARQRQCPKSKKNTFRLPCS